MTQSKSTIHNEKKTSRRKVLTDHFWNKFSFVISAIFDEKWQAVIIEIIEPIWARNRPESVIFIWYNLIVHYQKPLGFQKKSNLTVQKWQKVT